MSAIQFTTVIGPDGLIHPPTGVKFLPGEIEVSISLAPNPTGRRFSKHARELADRQGFNWDTLPQGVRAILIEDAGYEARGLHRPRPGPGACKGMILYMAPDFDAPLEDMKE